MWLFLFMGRVIRDVERSAKRFVGALAARAAACGADIWTKMKVQEVAIALRRG